MLRQTLLPTLVFLLTVLVFFDACDEGSSPGSGQSADDDDSSAVDDDTAGDDDTADDDAIDDDLEAATFQELLAFLEEDLEKNNVPGASLAIVLDGELRFQAGVGQKGAERPEPVDENTRYIVCSVTKMLTAGALMTLYDEGALDLQTPVTDFVPYFDLLPPADPSSLNTDQLLTHTAGLPDYLEENCATGDGALERWFRDNTDQPLWSPPGRLWNYSNLGYSLAGLVLEEISGVPFRQAMQERIFTPLGMDRLTFDPVAAMDGNHATGSSLGFDGSFTQRDFDSFGCAIAWPPGILFGSVVDLAHYAEMLLAGGGEVLSPATADLMQSPLVNTHMTPDDYYGYGLVSQDYKGVRLVWHDGGIEGFSTFWLIVPERKFGAVLFTNADYYDPSLVPLKAADLFLDLPDVEPPDYSTPPETWDKYTGYYYDPYVLGMIHVYQDDELELWAEALAFGETTRLVQYAADTFVVVYHGLPLIPVTFFLDDEGLGEYFATRAGVAHRVATPDALPPPAPTVDIKAWLARLARPHLD